MKTVQELHICTFTSTHRMLVHKKLYSMGIHQNDGLTVHTWKSVDAHCVTTIEVQFALLSYFIPCVCLKSEILQLLTHPWLFAIAMSLHPCLITLYFLKMFKVPCVTFEPQFENRSHTLIWWEDGQGDWRRAARKPDTFPPLPNHVIGAESSWSGRVTDRQQQCKVTKT